MKHFTIPIFIPELACPYTCIYCNQKTITGVPEIPKISDIDNLIKVNLKTINTKNSNVEIGFFGGNFTAIDIAIQEKLLIEAHKYILSSEVQSIRVSTRPDYITEESLKILKEHGVKTIELGVQSLDNDVLSQSGRGYNFLLVKDAAKKILDFGFVLGMQMMVGLPNDTEEKSFKTAQSIIELGATETRIYPCIIIKGTKLEELYIHQQYQPLSIDEAVNWITPIQRLFEENQIKILRIGLHPTEDFINGNAIVAGPFHISFKELVLSNIWREIFNKQIDVSRSIQQRLIIEVPQKELNYAIGYSSSNKAFLEKNFHKVKFVVNNNLKERQVNVCYS